MKQSNRPRLPAMSPDRLRKLLGVTPRESRRLYRRALRVIAEYDREMASGDHYGHPSHYEELLLLKPLRKLFGLEADGSGRDAFTTWWNPRAHARGRYETYTPIVNTGDTYAYTVWYCPERAHRLIVTCFGDIVEAREARGCLPAAYPGAEPDRTSRDEQIEERKRERARRAGR